MQICCKVSPTTFILLCLLWNLIGKVVTAKNREIGSDFEPVRPSDHVYPMAVVLYDEANLTPFQKEIRKFKFGDISISIKQNWKDVGVAAVVWDAVR